MDTIHEIHELVKPREGRGREIGHRVSIVRAQKIFNLCRLEAIIDTKSLRGQSDRDQGSQCYEGPDQGKGQEGQGLENLAIAKENLWTDGQGK